MLEGDLAAAKKLVHPSPQEVEAWFVTAEHNLHRFLGKDAPQTVAFHRTVRKALDQSEGFEPGSAKAGDIRQAVRKAVEHACLILEHYVRALRDEVGHRQ